MAADAGKDPAQEELERRMMELQMVCPLTLPLDMMDLGTQRREYISTVDAPSRFASVSKEELERTRRANVDPTIRRLAEQNKSRLSAWNTVHETLGDDVETEDLDSLMDGQSHRARLAELVKQHGGQNYVEPEPLYNGPSPSHNGGNMAGSTSKPRANASKPATDNVPKARPGPGSNGGITKKKRGGGGGGGGGAGGGTAGIVNAAGRTRKAAGPNNRAPHLHQHQAAAQKPPRVPVGALTFSGSMAHPDDFMKALQAAMPKTAPPTTHPGRPPVAFNFPAPRQAPARQPFVVLEDDPAAFMMKAASSTISSPPVTSPAMTAAVAAAPNAQPAAPNAQPATGSRQPPPACTPAGGQASETMTDNAPRPALESEREQQPRQTDEPAMSTTPPANLAPTPQQHAQQPEQVAASKPPPPTENLLDLDIDETATVCSRPLQPSASYDLASLVMDSTAPATPSPPPPPAAHSPPRQQSPGSPPTRKVGRAVEAYLRIFVNYRVELRKLRQFAKRTNLDDDLKEYIIRRKHEVEEDYHVLWEEVIERFPDIDIDDIEEEVLVRSLRVRVAVSDADLENLRKECEISKQQQQQRQVIKLLEEP
ncbi:hypothetical protein KEM52_001046 [Ascosphaera acerosa]|nr:hypothetical protein KEM52_001046 [Ascosphaera acerosa]